MNNQNILEVWGKMSYVGLDAEGNVHVIIEKKKNKININLIKKASAFTGKKVKVTIKKMPW